MSNDTQILTLVEFLTARIAEDEAVARAALDAPESEWWVDPRQQVTVRGAPSTRVAIAVTIGWKTSDHIARHDPARVLAECEAKRRIVDGEPIPTAEDRHSQWARTLRDLAAVYADHEDYREEWRP